MFGKLGEIAGLIKNFPKLKEEAEKLRQNLGRVQAEGEAGAGMVKVRANGHREVVSVQLSNEALKNGDREFLEDLIKAATNQALQKVQQQVAEEYAKMAANLGLPAGFGGMAMPGM
jgi:nucleoid-associated protein EbfC